MVKNKKKKVLAFGLAAVTAFSMASVAMAAENKDTQTEAASGTAAENGYTVDGLTLSVPEEYAGQLLVESHEADDDGVIFHVAEKASIEAAEKSGSGDSGAGWLFDIARVSEEKLHKMLCSDMSGADVIARDENNDYYLFEHPTDVRLVRESYDDMDDDLEQWGKLCEWADSVKDTFVEDNSTLTKETRGNSELDMAFSKIAYEDGVKYTISTTRYGPLDGSAADPASYLAHLLTGVTYSYADTEEAPDGEYVVLAFPDEGVRYDFFTGDKNLIRRVYDDDEDESSAVFFTAVFEDGASNAADIMQEWYTALAKASGRE